MTELSTGLISVISFISCAIVTGLAVAVYLVLLRRMRPRTRLAEYPSKDIESMESPPVKCDIIQVSYECPTSLLTPNQPPPLTIPISVTEPSIQPPPIQAIHSQPSPPTHSTLDPTLTPFLKAVEHGLASPTDYIRIAAVVSRIPSTTTNNINSNPSNTNEPSTNNTLQSMSRTQSTRSIHTQNLESTSQPPIDPESHHNHHHQETLKPEKGKSRRTGASNTKRAKKYYETHLKSRAASGGSVQSRRSSLRESVTSSVSGGSDDEGGA
ncbi:hypothetical protein HDU79_005372 [Rhizoclosmatium sp. JEL0117]|nr:hypothetical protein HDU79_005372 [Rhizoclosmatium sp. JEL0117]